PNLDTLTLDLQVTIQGASEVFDLTLDLQDAATHTVSFHSGPTPVTASLTPGGSVATPTPAYVGCGSNAAGVRFVASPSAAFFQDTITYTAEAFDGAGQAIVCSPDPVPIRFESSDTTKARVIDMRTGKVVA